MALGLLACWEAEVQAAEAAPVGLVTGPGLIVGSEGEDAVEHRAPPLSVPLRREARESRALRGAGVALCALGLFLVLVRGGAAGTSPRSLARLLWAAPGALGVWALSPFGGASAGGFALGALLLVLSMSLLAAWRD